MSIDKNTLSKIHKAIRESFKQSKKYQETLDAALSPKKGPRGGKRYVCSRCVNEFPQVDLELDHHPTPVTALDRRAHSYSPEEYYDRVFNLPVRVLCKPCHKKHSAEQKKLRK